MNLPATHPTLTPPRRGTGQPVLLPSWEGLGAGSGAQCAQTVRSALALPRRLAPVLLLTALAMLPLQADDWPQWLGPQRDGVWREAGTLEKFPAAGLKIRWRTAIGGGYAGPAVAGGRVYVADRQLSPG